MTSRFHGDGVRYKAKLIGVDPVHDARGDKMCWDSMMKLKGFESVARRQGKHKQRVWLNVSSSGLKIVDERTGAVLYDHDRRKISSLKKDESDPRALAYVYQHQNTYSLFYIKTANLAASVLIDIAEVCQLLDQEIPQEPAEAPTQKTTAVPLNESTAPPAEEPAINDELSSQPDSSTEQNQNQASFSNELMEVFSVQMPEPMMPTQSPCTSQPESPQPTVSTSQILPMFPAQPVGGSPYSSPPYSPTTMSWGQQGLLGNQWTRPAVAPWSTVPGSMATWTPAGTAAPPSGSQPGVMRGGNTPTALNGYPTPSNSLCEPTEATGPLQQGSPTLDQNLFQ
nr:disabled homolog 1-like isoform X2 [Scatophagus argus]